MSSTLPAAATRGRRRRFAIVALAGLVLLGGLVRAFMAEPFAIPSESMEPTLRPGDQVLVDKLSYRRAEPRRGDLAAFSAPDTGQVSLKRIVGLPGDRIEIQDGVLAVNGRRMRERYVDYAQVDSVYFGPIIVPPRRVFFLGDNRADSRDSRDFGPVAERSLIGRVLVRFWPPRG